VRKERVEVDVKSLTLDLIAEQDVLDDIVTPLADTQWSLPTPSPGWTVADQIAHLTYFDDAAKVAICDPSEFATMAGRLGQAAMEGSRGVDQFTLGPYRSLTPRQLLEAWRRSRRSLVEAAGRLDDAARVPWYGPSMGSKSFLTARLMETWAHGQDVVDTLGTVRPKSSRLRHIAQLGFLTRGWSYVNRGMPAPPDDVRLVLTGPGGDAWGFGPADADEFVTGPAEDFCLVVTQRRHLDDTGLETSPLARDWLLIAQAFAGPATNGPEVGSRP
jgi:uncharacterized protein (TIGR03084 family)